MTTTQRKPRTPAQEAYAERQHREAEERRTAAPPIVEDGKLDRVLNALEGLLARVENLETRQPQYVPMRREETRRETMANTYQPPEALMAQAKKSLTRADQMASGNTGPLANPENIAKIPPQYRPVFRSGSIVRINPDSLIWGSEDRRWGEILAARQSDGVGEVLAITYMTKTWEPKYTVYVHGVTGQTGDGFRESELLPA